MEVAAACPLCRQAVNLEIAGDGQPVICPSCSGEVLVQLGDVFFSQRTIDRCVVCGEQHLFRQKDFSQRLGCTIFVVGAGGGLYLGLTYSILWLWGILLATAALDWLLYRYVADVVICYRCKAHYRNLAANPAIGPYDLQLADAIEGRMGGGWQPPDSGP